MGFRTEPLLVRAPVDTVFSVVFTCNGVPGEFPEALHVDPNGFAASEGVRPGDVLRAVGGYSLYGRDIHTVLSDAGRDLPLCDAMVLFEFEQRIAD